MSIEHRYKGMSRIELKKFRFVYDGVFSLKGFLGAFYSYLESQDYCSRVDEKKFDEGFYLQQDTAKGKNLQIWWRVEKDWWLSPKKASMYRVDLNITIFVRGMKEVEFLKDGKKQKADKGEIEIELSGNRIVDPKGTWADHKWLKKHKDFIFETLFQKRNDASFGWVFGEIAGVHKFLKEYFRTPGSEGSRTMEEYGSKRPQE
jgi:hypothetical protein